MFSSLFSAEYLTQILLRIPAVLLALSVHECAHGYVALKLGDPTARNMGRLSVNPLKHIDPIGAICMLLFRFGWAKPVPVNSRYFKNPRRDMALTALAGPVSNLILGFIGLLIYFIFGALFSGLVFYEQNFTYNVCNLTLQFFSTFAFLNVALAVFNFIPIPPLDGSRILYVFLPPKAYFGVMKYERYIMLGMFVLLYLGVFNGVLSWAVEGIIKGMAFIITLIPGLG